MRQPRNVSLLDAASLVHSARNVLKIATELARLCPHGSSSVTVVSLVRVVRRLDQVLDSLAERAISSQCPNNSLPLKCDDKRRQ